MKPTPLPTLDDHARACFARGVLLGMALGILAALAGIALSLAFPIS